MPCFVFNTNLGNYRNKINQTQRVHQWSCLFSFSAFLLRGLCQTMFVQRVRLALWARPLLFLQI